MKRINIQHFGFYPFNPNLGQIMQSHVPGTNVDAAYVAHFHVAAADALVSDTDGVHAAINCSADTTIVVTTEFTNPSIPRNITATVAAEAADVGNIKAVKVKITGTNANGDVITEELDAFTADTAGSVLGDKAFATVTKVEIPAMDGAGVSVTIGFGEKLGLPYKLSHNTVLAAYHDNTLEAVAATVTVSATALEDNTIDLNTALNGKVVDAYLLV